MGDFVLNTEIQPRAGNRLITASSKPSLDDVDDWIEEAEAELLGTLAAGGIATTYAAGTRGFKIIRGWVGEYIAGRVRSRWAAAAGDGSNDDGQKEIDAWRALLKAIGDDPTKYSATLSADGGASSSALGIGSHIQDGTLGLEEADYRPVFRSWRHDNENY